MNTNKTALITGVTGQDGAYLSQLLLEKGYTILGTRRRNAQVDTERLARLGIDQEIEMIDLELADHNNVHRVVRESQPDEIYNLAAQSFVGASWNQPLYTADIDAMGVLRLLDSIRTFSDHTRFYQASTSEMYGRVRETPQNEDTPFHPRSPYGVAKLFGHYITVNYRESFGLFAVSGLLFNHESPLRGVEFVTRKITDGIARYVLGIPGQLELGNLDASRDWGYAKDYVKGMWMMLQQEKPDDFVLATGETTTIRRFCELAAQSVNIELEWQGNGVNERGIDTASGKCIISVNERFYRPAEVDILLGDASKASGTLGWEPSITIEELAAIMVEADLARISGRLSV